MTESSHHEFDPLPKDDSLASRILMLVRTHTSAPLPISDLFNRFHRSPARYPSNVQAAVWASAKMLGCRLKISTEPEFSRSRSDPSCEDVSVSAMMGSEGSV